MKTKNWKKIDKILGKMKYQNKIFIKKPKIKPKISGKTKNQPNILWSNEGHFTTTIKETVIRFFLSWVFSSSLLESSNLVWSSSISNLTFLDSKFWELSSIQKNNCYDI